MNVTLLAASILLVLTGLVHTVAGEIAWIRHVPAFQTPPLPMGTEQLAKRTIRVTWHLATLLAWGFAAIALDFARRGPDRFVLLAMAVTLDACAAVTAVGTRGKHPGWIAIGAAALLCHLA